MSTPPPDTVVVEAVEDGAEADHASIDKEQHKKHKSKHSKKHKRDNKKAHKSSKYEEDGGEVQKEAGHGGDHESDRESGEIEHAAAQSPDVQGNHIENNGAVEEVVHHEEAPAEAPASAQRRDRSSRCCLLCTSYCVPHHHHHILPLFNIGTVMTTVSRNGGTAHHGIAVAAVTIIIIAITIAMSTIADAAPTTDTAGGPLIEGIMIDTAAKPPTGGTWIDGTAVLIDVVGMMTTIVGVMMIVEGMMTGIGGGGRTTVRNIGDALPHQGKGRHPVQMMNP